MEKENVILKLSFEFALEIVSYTRVLETQKQFNLANQLFRSGTSIGANVREAQGAESRSDFKHKMKIAYKEAEETAYWFELCKQSEHLPDPPEKLFEMLNSIRRLLGKIITTSSI